MRSCHIFVVNATRTRDSQPWLGHLQGWLATSKPPVGEAGQGLTTCKGATSCGQGPLQGGDQLWPRPSTRGWLDAARASLQGQQPPAGIATCSAALARSGRQRLARKGRSQRPGLPLAGVAALIARVDAGWQGQPSPAQGRRRWRRRGKRG
ncbi:hypothetical protein BHM03_00010002 [Ensete ventricosum]|nr:hypothetical protein BHM03_00010002 [Ensete ventricosum]